MTLKKAAEINIALYAFVAMNPFFRWVLPNELFYALFLGTTIVITSLLIIYCPRLIGYNNSYKKIVLTYLVLFILYMASPIIHDARWGHLLWYIPLILIVSYDDTLIVNSYHILRKIIVWISIFSLIILFIKEIGISLPYIKLDVDFRYSPLDNYRCYGPIVSLYRGGSPFEVFGIERICGAFAEPGHFGIYLGLILVIEKFDFSKFYNKILLIAGLFTFSTAFYGILFLGLIYFAFVKRSDAKYWVSIIGLTFLIVLFWDYLNEFLFNSSVNALEDMANVADNRVSDQFIETFDVFIESPDALLGVGYYTTYYNDVKLAITNWRGFVFSFGFVGLILIITLPIIIIRRTKSVLYQLLMFGTFLIVFLHRSYLLYNPWMYILLYFAVTLDCYNNRIKNIRV